MMPKLTPTYAVRVVADPATNRTAIAFDHVEIEVCA